MKTTLIALFLLVILNGPGLSSAGQEPLGQGDQEIIHRAQEFVACLERGDFESATKYFDATMKEMSPPQKMEQFWKDFQTQVGAFKKQGDVRVEQVTPYEVVFVTVEFSLVTLEAKVVFDRSKAIAGYFFVPKIGPAEFKPAAYVNRDSFREVEVVIGSGEWALPGTLTLPKGAGPFPALVLVHGSGPNDRDETIGPNKPFCDLAWGLASRGLAVLRYEKRTKAHSNRYTDKELLKSLTAKEETVDDAVAAVALLRMQAEINPKKIFVLGHSLGGMLVPRIGAAEPGISGFIIMAGTTRPIEDLIVEQMTYIYSLDGQMTPEKQAKLDEFKAQAAKVKALKPTDASSDEFLLGVAPKYWLDLRGYDPAAAARRLRQPMLILQGGRDYQVTLTDFDNWKKVLSGRSNIEFKLYPKANHLFIEGEGKSSPEEYGRPSHVAEAVVEDIARWIKKR